MQVLQISKNRQHNTIQRNGNGKRNGNTSTRGGSTLKSRVEQKRREQEVSVRNCNGPRVESTNPNPRFKWNRIEQQEKIRQEKKEYGTIDHNIHIALNRIRPDPMLRSTYKY